MRMLSACRCTFCRNEGEEWEEGIATVYGFGQYDIVSIIPDVRRSITDHLNGRYSVHEYRLDWKHAIDSDLIEIDRKREAQEQIVKL